MSIRSTTLRPGYLVSLKTSIEGNVDTQRQVIEAEHTTDNGQLRAVWKTERTVIDPQEHEEAVKIRSRARALLTGVCARSDFGYLCPDEKFERLGKVIDDAKKLCDDFNRTSAYTQVKFFTITGRIATDDQEAVRAINNEVRGLLDDMKQGIDKLDVEAVRAAANKAKQLGSMLSPDAQTRIDGAISAVRSMAKRMIKAGETAATEIDEATLTKLAEARTAFLDIDGGTEVAAPDDSTGRGIDLDPNAEVIEVPEQTAPALDLEDILG